MHADPGSEQRACVCARPQLSDRSHWPSRWRLQPCDPQSRTRDRHDTGPVTKGGPVWRDSQAAGVCVSMFMEYAFMPARKSWARSPPPTPRVSGYGRGQRSCGFFQPLFQNQTFSLLAESENKYEYSVHGFNYKPLRQSKLRHCVECD